MSRNFGLDILRSLSIWLVLLQHAGIYITGLYPLSLGLIGVEVFFVLSGFLIGGILIKTIDEENSLKTLKTFWMRRWLRILPLYYLVLLIKFFFIDSSIEWNILYYLFFLQNNFLGIQFYPVSWSLVIEEWFYIFSPLFLMFVYKISKKKKNILIYLCLFIFLENLLRVLYVITLNIPYQGINGNVPFRFDSLFIGVILAFLKTHRFSFYEQLQKARYFFVGLFLFLTYLLLFWFLAYPVNRVDDLLFPRTAGFFILGLSIGLMVPYIEKYNTIGISLLPGKLIYHSITYTSILTYGIYLFHPLIYSYVFSDYFYGNSWSAQFFSAIILTYLVAAMGYYLFEKQFLILRDKLTNY